MEFKGVQQAYRRVGIRHELPNQLEFLEALANHARELVPEFEELRAPAIEGGLEMCPPLQTASELEGPCDGSVGGRRS